MMKVDSRSFEEGLLPFNRLLAKPKPSFIPASSPSIHPNPDGIRVDFFSARPVLPLAATERAGLRGAPPGGAEARETEQNTLSVSQDREPKETGRNPVTVGSVETHLLEVETTFACEDRIGFRFKSVVGHSFKVVGPQVGPRTPFLCSKVLVVQGLQPVKQLERKDPRRCLRCHHSASIEVRAGHFNSWVCAVFVFCWGGGEPVKIDTPNNSNILI